MFLFQSQAIGQALGSATPEMGEGDEQLVPPKPPDTGQGQKEQMPVMDTEVQGRHWADEMESEGVVTEEDEREKIRKQFLKNSEVIKSRVEAGGGWRNRRDPHQEQQHGAHSGAGATASHSLDELLFNQAAPPVEGVASTGVRADHRWGAGVGSRRNNFTAPDAEGFRTVKVAAKRRCQEFTPPAGAPSSKAARGEEDRIVNPSPQLRELQGPGEREQGSGPRGRQPAYDVRQSGGQRGAPRGAMGGFRGRGTGQMRGGGRPNFQAQVQAEVRQQADFPPLAEGGGEQQGGGRGRGGADRKLRGRGRGGVEVGRSYRDVIGGDGREGETGIQDPRGREGDRRRRVADTQASRRRVITVDVELPDGHTVVPAPMLADICRRIGIMQESVKGVQALYKKVELLVDNDVQVPVVLGKRDQVIRGEVILRNIREEEGERVVKVRVMGMSWKTEDSKMLKYLDSWPGRIVAPRQVLYDVYTGKDDVSGYLNTKLKGSRWLKMILPVGLSVPSAHWLDGRRVRVEVQGRRECVYCLKRVVECLGRGNKKECKKVNLVQAS